MENTRKFHQVSQMEGAWTRSLPRIQDSRGYFSENFTIDEFGKLNLSFKQSSISYSKARVFRGFHFQANQWQLITVFKGEINDFLVDMDNNSPTFKEFVELNLDALGVNQLLIKPTIAHAFLTIGEETIINYLHTEYYQPENQLGFSYMDPTVRNRLKFEPNNYEISARDKSLGTFADAAYRCAKLIEMIPQ